MVKWWTSAAVMAHGAHLPLLLGSPCCFSKKNRASPPRIAL
jgi:hypothetical protein